MVLQLHSSSWKYQFKNNTGGAVDDIDVEFSELVAVIYAYDDGGGTDTWTCVTKLYGGSSDRKWHCDKDSGTLGNHHVLTIVGQTQTKKNVVNFVWSTP